jgi:hypothetical protein
MIIVKIVSSILILLLITYSLYLILFFIRDKKKRYSNLVVGSALLIISSILLYAKISDYLITNSKLKWSHYKDIEGNFFALFPGNVIKGEKQYSYGNFIEIKSDLTKKRILSTFLIKYIKKLDNEKIIQYEMENDFSNNFVLLEKKESALIDFKVFDYSMITKDKEWEMKKKYLYNKNILYIITVIGSPINEIDAKKFFDSFHILK